jgi:DNA-binding MarR family transcriptional regulator
MIRTTKFEQSILCVLCAAEPRSLKLREVADELNRYDPSSVGWTLKLMEERKLVERGTDPSTWQLTTFGRKYWKDLIQQGMEKQS